MAYTGNTPNSGLLRRGRRAPESISIIVSSYNQPRALELTLRALAEQTVKADEILIADDGSTDDTFALIDALQRLDGLPPLRVHTQADRGFRKTVALNAAILASRGQQLLFLDGDVMPPRDWVARHRAVYRPMGYAVGDYARLSTRQSEALYDLRRHGERRRTAIESLAAEHGRRLFWRHSKACFHIACRKPTRPRLLGGNFSVDRGLLFGVNGFDERFAGTGGEDSNLRNRLNRYGGRPTSLVRSAVGIHLNPRLDMPAYERNRASYLHSPMRHETTDRRALLGLAERMNPDVAPISIARPAIGKDRRKVAGSTWAARPA
ncbi:glycosyl transferase family protein [Salinisphaera dokdonensis CL-ES53]|uniref:Glycosyl transferase family protein n=1 Tax=Salinisphaera dokdonensis CL-ES53 TaxID=1304272 RepID=A0ABV2AYL8_9GAMM